MALQSLVLDFSPGIILAFSLAGCGDGVSADSGQECVSRHAVFTDIDETLTTADEEWLAQFADPSYDPAMRPDANTLMQAYWELGYTIYYVTARGRDLSLSDGRSAMEATQDWLQQHEFPLEDGVVYLADGIGVYGDSAVEYKSGVITDLVAQGWEASWAYGNAETDILAFQDAGIPDDHIYLVGERAGTMDVLSIPDDQAYTQHLQDHLGEIVDVGCP